MISQAHINTFNSRLTEILTAELRLGNVIVETADGWPKSTSILIFLKLPFFGEYHFDKIAYRDLNDIHYWKAEYFDKEGDHVLACGFGSSIPPVR